MSLLNNGLPVYWDPMPQSRGASIGVWIRAGSRYESFDQGGVTHFLEHMCFKGTNEKNAQEIANEMDFLGGEMNAFTSQEVTSFYAMVLSENAPRAARLLGDLLVRSVFDPEELEREKGVVLEELMESKDDPEDLVSEQLFSSFFSQHPFGRPILGTEESIQAFSRESVRSYFQENYHAGSMFITIAGNVDWSLMLETLESAFGDSPKKQLHRPIQEPPAEHYGIWESDEDFEQVHMNIGVKGISQSDPRQSAMRLLSTHLGGGMSSRLFQEVREKRGLAYSIYSSPMFFSDGGIVRIMASTRPSKRKELQEVLLAEIARVEAVPLTAAELARSRNQLKSSLLFGLETVSGRMSKMGRNILTWGEEVPVWKIEQWIDEVTPADIQSLARDLNWASEQGISVMGPLKKARKGQ